MFTKTSISFVVHGKTVSQLKETALETYRKLLDDPSADFSDVTVNYGISPHVLTHSGEIIFWSADVEIFD